MAEAKVKEGYVDLTIPRGNQSDEKYVLIGLNGKLYKLPKGKTSSVPKAVKDEYERSQRAQARFDETVDAAIEMANEKK